MMRGDWIKPGAVVIDGTTNVIPDPNSPKGQRLVGDVCFSEAQKVASYITPIPGGVGPMTVVMLMASTVQSAKLAAARSLQTEWHFEPLTLKLLRPVPSDIAIARAQTPKDIEYLAKEVGLLRKEISLCGDKIAEVSLGVLDKLRDRRVGNVQAKIVGRGSGGTRRVRR